MNSLPAPPKLGGGGGGRTMAAPITAAANRTKPYWSNGAKNSETQSKALLPSRRYPSKPAIDSTASSASMEYSRASWACSMAAVERVAGRAARNAAQRFTPKRGNKNNITATVKTPAVAGRTRMLKAETSTFWTAHSARGYRIGEVFLLRVLGTTSERAPLELLETTASSYHTESPDRSWKRSPAATTSKTTQAA